MWMPHSSESQLRPRPDLAAYRHVHMSGVGPSRGEEWPREGAAGDVRRAQGDLERFGCVRAAGSTGGESVSRPARVAVGHTTSGRSSGRETALVSLWGRAFDGRPQE